MLFFRFGISESERLLRKRARAGNKLRKLGPGLRDLNDLAHGLNADSERRCGQSYSFKDLPDFDLRFTIIFYRA